MITGKRYFVRELRAVGVTGSTVSLRDIQGKPDESIVYNRVVCENVDSANSDFRIGVERIDQFFTVRYFADVAANTPQTHESEIFLASDDENLRIDVTDSTDSDDLRVWVFGFTIREAVNTVA